MNARKLAPILLVVLLAGCSLKSCSSNDTPKTGIICGVTLTVIGALTIAGVVEATPITFLGVLPKCIEFAYDAVTSANIDSQTPTASNAASSGQPTKQVTFDDKNYYPNNFAQATIPYNLPSNYCIPLIVPNMQPTINLGFTFPINMAIGTQPDGVYHTNPTGQSDQDFVGRAVISKYALKQQTTVNNVVNVSLGSQQKGTVTIQEKVPYAYGLAMVTQDNTTTYVPWTFVSGAPELQLKVTVPNCS